MSGKIKKIVRNSILLTLLIVLGKVSIPLSGIPFTLQLLMVFIICLISDVKDSITIILLYIVIGLLGAPIFALGGGFGYIYQPSFGFIVGFLLAPFPIAFIKKTLKIKNRLISFLIATLFSLIIDYIIGFVYALIIFNVKLDYHYSTLYIFEIVILPFIILDIIKCILASFTANRLINILK